MKIISPAGGFLVCMLLLAGCNYFESDETVQTGEIEENDQTEGGAMNLTSSAFSDGGTIPKKYVMVEIGGQNVSLPFALSNIPEGTLSLALSIVDTHPIASNWVHWLVVNLPEDTTSLAEGASGSAMPAGSTELQNSYGFVGYGGPQPPTGSGDHSYVCTVYALKVEKVSISSTTTLSAFNSALQGKILAQVQITGMYGR